MAQQPRTIEFALLRGGSPLTVETVTRNRVLRYREAVRIGEQPGCRIFLPRELTGVSDYPLLVPRDDGWALNLAHHAMRGAVREETEVRTVDALRTDGALEADLLPLRCGTRCRLEFGDYAVLVGAATLPPRPAGKGLSRDRASELSWYMASFLAHLALLAVFVMWHPSDPIQIRRHNNSHLARVLSVESVLLKDTTPPEEEPPEEVEEADPNDAKLTPTDTVTLSRRETELVAAPKPEFSPRSALPRKPAPAIAGPMRLSERMVPQARLAAIIGVDLRGPAGPAPGIRIIGDGGDDRPSGFPVELGGGGGPDLDLGPTVGPDRITIPDLVPDKRRIRRPQFTEKVPVVVVPKPPSISGEEGLPRSIIKKYVERQRGGIARCYKRAVQRQPDLSGQVTLQFVIGPSGTVLSSRIGRSTLGHAVAEACMAQRVKLWRFPAPLGGAAVRVRYPFLFRSR